ncbi:MAG: ferredoxin-type protein NapF [Thauera propionica]|uniref:ferredoxin-type protein NapF n=1 Tax=Thauera TaxID=33057 RepID=UPI0023F5931C|nr:MULTISPECIES: ferredoxin-type protein NapF [Thauera]MDD3674609.1 ferredoxin-type protein NapF [Thauera propionica]MDY0045934.1 ferredoxin-type protein NapF [Thauera propionica]
MGSGAPVESASPSRRGFLRGRVRAVAPAMRPPWAREEHDFISSCTRCDICIDACPTAILVRADGGFPAVDFSLGECTFCGECVTRCAPRALLRRAEGEAPWALKASIGQACLAEAGVECRVCGESCPTGAIRFRPRIGGVALPQLDADTCTGCGACFASCPTRAIVVKAESEVPTESEQ